MAIAHVQSKTNGVVDVSGTSCAVAFDSNVTAGNLLIGYVYAGDANAIIAVTAADTLGQTWSQAVLQRQSTDKHVGAIFYFANTAGGANTVTFTFTGGTPTDRCSVAEFSGAATSSPLDQTNHAEGSSTTPTSGSITPTQDGELLVCVATGDGGAVYTAGTDFSKNINVPDATNTRIGGEYYIQPTAAAHNGTWSIASSQNWTSEIASFKAAAAGTTSFIAAFQPGTNLPVFSPNEIVAY